MDNDVASTAGRSAARTRTRSLLVRLGMETASERGFSAMGIDTVLRQAGVPKGSFYYYFKSKDDFGLAVIDGYAEYFAHRLQRIFQDQSRKPLEQLDAFIESGAAGLRKYDFKRGCLVGNLSHEISILHPDLRQRLESVIRQWEVCVEHCLRSAQQRGELHAHIDAPTAAKFFWIGWEGAVLRAKLAQSIEPLGIFRSQFFHYLGRDPRQEAPNV